MPYPIEHGGKWIIEIRKSTPNNQPTQTGTFQGESTQRAIREFWTGDGWQGQRSGAMLFATKSHAQVYMTENMARM